MLPSVPDWGVQLSHGINLPPCAWSAYQSSGLAGAFLSDEPIRLTVEHRGRLVSGHWLVREPVVLSAGANGARVTCTLVLLAEPPPTYTETLPASTSEEGHDA